ncbi:MAG: hypothetical protein AB1651_19720 [Pseudomonadota bacterium]
MRNHHLKAFGVIGAFAAAALLVACSYSLVVECSTSTRSCTARGEIKNKNATVADVQSFDAVQASLQLSGNVPVVATNGSVILHLYNGSTLVAASGFGWLRSGSVVRFASPAVVNAWIQAHAQPTYRLEYSLDGMTYSPVQGSNTLAVSLYYAGNHVATSSSGWSEYGGDWRDEP